MSVDLNSPANIRRLKLIVTVLAVLIVLALAVLAGGFAGAIRDAEEAGLRRERELLLAPGSAVVDMTALGDKLVLHVKRADGEEELVLVDPKSGETMGRIALKR
jgi:hypothetical protein